MLVVDIIIGYISGLRFDLMDDSGENIKKMLWMAIFENSHTNGNWITFQ